MQAYYDYARRKCSHNIENLYLKFDQIATEAFRSGEMKENSIFTASVTNGVHYVFRFYKNMTEIYAADADNLKKLDPILETKENESTDEYKERQTSALRAIGVFMKAGHNCFGQRFPEGLRESLNNITPGTLISFNNGSKYVCVDRHNSILGLRKVYSGGIQLFSLDSIKNTEMLVLDINHNAQMQQFFMANNKDYTERMELNVSFLDDAKKAIESIETGVIETGETKRIDMGNMNLLAKKSKKHDQCIWFDLKGKKIDREDVILIRALMDCMPYERNYVRSSTNNKLDFEFDSQFEQHLENLAVEGQFKQMYKDALEYVKQNSGDLVLETLQFEKYEDNYEAARIYFAEENGKAKAFKVVYEGNSFLNDEKAIFELSADEFEELCNQVYNKNYLLLYRRTEELAVQAILNSREAEDLAKKSMDSIKKHTGFANGVKNITESRIKKMPQIIKSTAPQSEMMELSQLLHEYMKAQSGRQVIASEALDEIKTTTADRSGNHDER